MDNAYRGQAVSSKNSGIKMFRPSRETYPDPPRGKRTSSATILDKMDEKLRPPLPHFKDEKNGAFSL